MRQISALVLLALALAGCDNPLTPEERVAGMYDLESINAQPLPYEMFGVVITEGSLELFPHGTYTGRSVMIYEDWDTGRLVTENSIETGTYTVTDNRLRLTSKGGEQVDATVAGRTITINTGLLVAVYRRR
jgi:hypothetical protein